MNATQTHNGTHHVEIEQGLLDKIISSADLGKLSTAEKSTYYQRVCQSLELNPLTKPFEYLLLKGKGQEPDKMVLYATKSCTDQLRDKRTITLNVAKRELIEGVYVVTAVAKTPDGRQDEDDGAVSLTIENGSWQTNDNGRRFFKGDGTFKPLTGEARANAMMKAITKAKRRVTLSICGLGMLDESEIDSIPGAHTVPHHDEKPSEPEPWPTPPDQEKINRELAEKRNGTHAPPSQPVMTDEQFRAAIATAQREVSQMTPEALGDTSEALEKEWLAKVPGARGERSGQLARAVRESWIRAQIQFCDLNDMRDVIRASGLKPERIEMLIGECAMAEKLMEPVGV